MPPRAPTFNIDCVLPAYNEVRLLPQFLESIASQLSDFNTCSVHIIVVDDGSTADAKAAYSTAVENFNKSLDANSPHQAMLLTCEQNAGKGSAIRKGWAVTRPDAQWLGFVDSDGAVSARELLRLIAMCPETSADALWGARIRMAGKTIERSARRHIQGRIFATLVTQILNLVSYDSQCGLKLFRSQILRDVLPELEEDRWLLDVELLAVLTARGAKFEDVPIDWADLGDSKVRWYDPVKMAAGLLKMRSRLRKRGVKI